MIPKKNWKTTLTDNNYKYLISNKIGLIDEASVYFNVTTVDMYDIWCQECTTPV